MPNYIENDVSFYKHSKCKAIFYILFQDSLGNRMDHNHEFSLDGTSPLFAVSGRFALMVDLASFVSKVIYRLDLVLGICIARFYKTDR